MSTASVAVPIIGVALLVFSSCGDGAPASPPEPVSGAPIDASVTPNDLAPTSRPDLAPPYFLAPPAPKGYSGGACPVLVSGPTIATSFNPNFQTAGGARTFHLIVPPSYDGSEPWPLMFGWHWLNADSSQLITSADLETAADKMHFIGVYPDALRNADGSRTFEFDWPFAEFWGQTNEMTFFDDLLSCVTEQYKIDPRKVYAMGASAGGLWATFMSMTDRAEYFASIVIASGGLGEEAGVWQMNYMPQVNKFPALVIWGGVTDWFILDFNDASIRLRDALINDHHFVATCTHSSGHAMPPIVPAPGSVTLLQPLWQFLFDHPYGLPPGYSPYLATGLSHTGPAGFPNWCTVPPQ